MCLYSNAQSHHERLVSRTKGCLYAPGISSFGYKQYIFSRHKQKGRLQNNLEGQNIKHNNGATRALTRLDYGTYAFDYHADASITV